MDNDFHNLENSLEADSDSEQRSGSSHLFFDNPLLHKILTKDNVAALLKKGTTWVERNTAPDRLRCHYVGDTAMYYLDEVIEDFLSGKLARTRKVKAYEHKANHQQGRNGEAGSHGETSRTKKNLEEVRRLRRGVTVAK